MHLLQRANMLVRPYLPRVYNRRLRPLFAEGMPMYHRPASIFVLIAAALLLYLGVRWGTNATLYSAFAIFFLWDLGYVRSEEGFQGRDPKDVLQHAHGARQYLQWFFAFYSIFLGALFAFGQPRQDSFLYISTQAGVEPWLLTLPLFTAAIAMLFIPIQISDSTGKHFTSALKTHLFVQTFLQKVAVFTFAHAAGRILYSVLG